VKTLFDYHVVCHRDDNGSFVAYVPAIDGCHAIGRTPEEAQHELHNVFGMIAEEHIERGVSLPDDVELTVAHAR
jgi:predicted RNase H-like HicB family nuclease